MSRLRFPIAGLMLIVLFVAVALAALRSTSELGASALFTLTLALLSTSVLMAIAYRGRTRITWAGFAIFGLTYLVGPWLNKDEIGPPPLLGTELLRKLQPYVFSGAGAGGRFVLNIGKTSNGLPPLPIPAGAFVINQTAYRQVSHLLGAIIFALIGAILGLLFPTRDARTDL
jgi:hypothetical protein